MPDGFNPGDTLSDSQKVISTIAGLAMVNRWSFGLDFDAEGLDVSLRIPYDADGAPPVRRPISYPRGEQQ